MNTYKKFCPNVFVAQCDERHDKGSIIELTTKRGKVNRHIVWNLLGRSRDGKYFYSITREDGYNLQERAKSKADKYQEWEQSAKDKSQQYYEASQEGRDFLSLAEPIKIGHHSERRHRALIDRNWNRMGKSVEFNNKAEEHRAKAEYWESRANEINLSIPESLEYFEYKLEEAKEKHQFYKDNPDKREHSYSLTYAKKEVNEMTKKLETAKKLWGDN